MGIGAALAPPGREQDDARDEGRQDGADDEGADVHYFLTPSIATVIRTSSPRPSGM